MNSRWSTHPIKRAGQVVSIRPNVAGDIEILKYLGRYTVLTAEDIAALTRRSYGAVIARLNLLKREPNKFIQVHRTQLESPRLYQWSAQAFHLTNKGIAKLQEIGFEVAQREPSIHFIHALTESQTAASFEIGARERLIPFNEILNSPSTPKPIVESGDHSIPVAFCYKSKDYNYRLTPDGRPFGIAYSDDTYRFCVFETDCASEPLVSSNRDRQAIETKLAAYLTVLEHRLYETHFGLPNLTILFTSTTKTRVENMIALLASMSAKYLNCFGFTQFPTIIGDAPQPTDRGWAFNRPWLQSGGKTLNLREH
ncbi:MULTISPECIES: hypothetical protein [unclassified Bradyrhizobium]|uniref:hypothetical protein n=1 Tax=unclassified Bradyrhizobium TaxID=2631580 RepID=UPI001FFB77D4|nr:MULTISPECIES: hypothetical protein [unclassified Bradyrhizobium]MCK1709723.1 hypothetical protein [Bradyrhizobium sp. 143]MCK1725417.1 hypothetical protein [Bradyrhizobium sp. 142]